jgi:hypothetical protein
MPSHTTDVLTIATDLCAVVGVWEIPAMKWTHAAIVAIGVTVLCKYFLPQSSPSLPPSPEATTPRLSAQAMPAQAADTGKVTLACEGTTSMGDGPVSESVIVDYNARKTFSEIAGHVYPDIKDSVPEKVFSTGKGIYGGITNTVSIDINRITGDLQAIVWHQFIDSRNQPQTIMEILNLKCRVAQRMF